MPNVTKEKESKTINKLCPKYKVILHNDDVNDVLHVLECLMNIVGLSGENAHGVMLTAHTTGRALVITCVLEHAEYYKEGLQSKGLTVSIEEE